jgi:hypothetical protein
MWKERGVKKSVIAEVSFIFILGFLAIYDGIRLTKVRLLNPDPVGPGWYLIIFSGLLLLCGILYLVLPRYRKAHMKREAVNAPRSFAMGTGGWLMIVLLAYVIAIPLLGYTPASVFFFILAMHIAGVKSWPKSIAYGVAMAIAFTLFFSKVAGMSLP